VPELEPNVVAAFAAFVRQRLSVVGSTVRATVRATATAPLAPLAPLVPRLRRESGDLVPANDDQRRDRRNIAMVIVAAAETFAPTAQARARLLRQAHASGVLSARETEDALGELRALGAPRS
jgi:hypothetical protein